MRSTMPQRPPSQVSSVSPALRRAPALRIKRSPRASLSVIGALALTLTLACAPRNPYAVMCGAAMDTSSAIGSVRLAVVKHETADAGKYRELALAQVDAAGAALTMIDDSGIRGDVVWTGIRRAIDDVTQATNLARTGAAAVEIETLLESAQGHLGAATEVLPEGCLTP